MLSLFKYDDYCVELPPSFLTFYSIIQKYRVLRVWESRGNKVDKEANCNFWFSIPFDKCQMGLDLAFLTKGLNTHSTV